MKIFDSLKKVVSELQSETVHWAIAGGVAASLYRSEPRFTGDIDIILSGESGSAPSEVAEKILKRLGYKPIVGFISTVGNTALGPPSLIAARETQQGSFVGIDFILPVLPWVESAITRAQLNKLDFGFAQLPTITPEDLIIAKLFAIADNPERLQDRDDIISILKQPTRLDRAYIYRQLEVHKLAAPSDLVKLL